MIRRLKWLFTFIIFFWAVSLIAGWLLTKIYLPIAKNLTIALIGGYLLSDILIWIYILLIFSSILLTFRELFYYLFRREAAKT